MLAFLDVIALALAAAFAAHAPIATGLLAALVAFSVHAILRLPFFGGGFAGTLAPGFALALVLQRAFFALGGFECVAAATAIAGGIVWVIVLGWPRDWSLRRAFDDEGMRGLACVAAGYASAVGLTLFFQQVPSAVGVPAPRISGGVFVVTIAAIGVARLGRRYAPPAFAIGLAVGTLFYLYSAPPFELPHVPRSLVDVPPISAFLRPETHRWAGALAFVALTLCLADPSRRRPRACAAVQATANGLLGSLGAFPIEWTHGEQAESPPARGEWFGAVTLLAIVAGGGIAWVYAIPPAALGAVVAVAVARRLFDFLRPGVFTGAERPVFLFSMVSEVALGPVAGLAGALAALIVYRKLRRMCIL